MVISFFGSDTAFFYENPAPARSSFTPGRFFPLANPLQRRRIGAGMRITGLYGHISFLTIR